MAIIKFKNEVPSLIDTLLGREFFDFHNNAAEGSSLPAVNIKESNDAFTVEVAAPGMTKEDFKLSINNNVLVISSEKENEREETEGKYTRKEFSYASFQRTFTLPQSVDQEKVQATYKDGVLLITVPKREEAKVKPLRKIEIQ